MATSKLSKTKRHKKHSRRRKTGAHLSQSQAVVTGPSTSLAQPSELKPRRRWLPGLWIILATLGLNLMLGSAWYYSYRQTVLSFRVTPTVTGQLALRGELPIEVIIPDHHIQTSVIPAQITDGVWETSDTAATHLVSSARPAEGGNIVIYGHNRKHLLGNLKTVKLGDTIQVKTQDNKLYEYTVMKKMIVNPDQIEAVLPTDHEILTIYTCTGLFDSQRLVLQASPSAVSSTL
ncbi:MAG TPA: sortase [Vitreimonas sp.]|nr:sortase [Vitreimonas sp.]